MKKHLPLIVAGAFVVTLAVVVYLVWLKPRPEEPTKKKIDVAKEKQEPPPEKKPRPPSSPPPVAPAPVSLAKASEFLYGGDKARQTGVKPGTIQPLRAAVLRGKVTDRDGKALAGVTVRVQRHPEFGSTTTGEDGIFDLAVNGGGQLCVLYVKEGLLPLCRNVSVPRQDYAWLPDVVLIPADKEVTSIELQDKAPIQVARGSVVKDQDGPRQPTLFIQQGKPRRFLPTAPRRS